LKKYHYYYWFAFPALCPEEAVTADKAVSLETYLTSEQMMSLQSSWDRLPTSSDRNFFLVAMDGDTIYTVPLREHKTFCQTHPKFYAAFSDPCTLDSNPGWPLRNFIILLARKWAGQYTYVDILCYRDRVSLGVRSCSHSIVLKVKLPTKPESFPKVVGWEKNEKQKLSPRMVNMSSSMDPTRLAQSAVDLNLKLMRWRLIPGIDLECVANTRCLLLGAGTLGCNVARCLLGWGVRTITFVDNGQVSYSNPVRQSLFQFDDCLGGGKAKAVAAADGLKRVFPEVNATGHVLSIPMPGHAVGSAGESFCCVLLILCNFNGISAFVCILIHLLCCS
jgi:ubiquitin-like modifier-activating enzyme ATG7